MPDVEWKQADIETRPVGRRGLAVVLWHDPMLSHLFLERQGGAFMELWLDEVHDLCLELRRAKADIENEKNDLPAE